MSVPGFGVFIAFIGSFACASLAFILPATCHLALFAAGRENGAKMPAWQAAMDYGLIMFGFVGMVFGVGESLHAMLTGSVAARA